MSIARPPCLSSRQNDAGFLRVTFKREAAAFAAAFLCAVHGGMSFIVHVPDNSLLVFCVIAMMHQASRVTRMDTPVHFFVLLLDVPCSTSG